jgi:hypothetical protein
MMGCPLNSPPAAVIIVTLCDHATLSSYAVVKDVSHNHHSGLAAYQLFIRNSLLHVCDEDV